MNWLALPSFGIVAALAADLNEIRATQQKLFPARDCHAAAG